MPVTVDCNGTRWLIRLEGEVTLSSAAQFKGALIEGLALAQELELDLERAAEIDVTVLQLVWAAGRAAARAGLEFRSRTSLAVANLALELGFDSFPGATGQADQAAPVHAAGQPQG